MENAAAQV